jgi:putative transcriptional regulator
MKLTGNLIIAPPSVTKKFWRETVIMITEHHTDGSIGLILNKPSTVSIADLGDQLDIELDLPGLVFIGGPINTTSISVLHSNDWVTDNTYQINDQFSLSSSEEMLTRLTNGDTPKQWRMFVGMCGWDKTQLIAEIAGTPPYNHNTSWCTATANLALAFDHTNIEQWKLAIDQSSIDFAQNLLT